MAHLRVIVMGESVGDCECDASLPPASLNPDPYPLIGASEMRLDRLWRDVQGLAYLGVALSARNEVGDLPFAG